MGEPLQGAQESETESLSCRAARVSWREGGGFVSSSAFFGFSPRNSFPISEYSFILTGCSHFIGAIVAWISLRILRIIFLRQNILIFMKDFGFFGDCWLRVVLVAVGGRLTGLPHI